MSICQPIQTLIDAHSFQGGVYSFMVESVLDSVASPGSLMVSVSAGYLLTTSSSNQPRREQTLEYKRQDDDHWQAAGSVTITQTNGKVVDGTVIIQNAHAESKIMSVTASSVALTRSQPTALAINQPALNFAPTVPGKPSFLVFTISQPQTDTPVTITTDATDLFQLATDSRPRFSPEITFNPSATGSHVHVRYLADKRGVHTGHLLLTSEFENTSVPLTGRSQGSLPAALSSSVQSTSKTTWAILLPTLVAGCLLVASYNKQLFSDLDISSLTSRVDKEQPVTGDDEAVLRKKTNSLKPSPANKANSSGSTQLVTKRSADNSLDSVSAIKPTLDRSKIVAHKGHSVDTTNDPSSRRTTTTMPTRNPPRTLDRDDSNPLNQESDLERELNQAVPQ